MSRTTPIHKRPTGRGKFSWCRVPLANDGVSYRLYRRCDRNALHASFKRFPPGHDRTLIAITLNAMRHELRDRVDELDLMLMGVEA
jgi:hypothetical protein